MSTWGMGGASAPHRCRILCAALAALVAGPLALDGVAEGAQLDAIRCGVIGVVAVDVVDLSHAHSLGASIVVHAASEAPAAIVLATASLEGLDAPASRELLRTSLVAGRAEGAKAAAVVSHSEIASGVQAGGSHGVRSVFCDPMK